eukprot:363795-Chlamydomonas_euryale.AAC.9
MGRPWWWFDRGHGLRLNAVVVVVGRLVPASAARSWRPTTPTRNCQCSGGNGRHGSPHSRCGRTPSTARTARTRFECRAASCQPAPHALSRPRAPA